PIFWKKKDFDLEASGGFWLHPQETPNIPATDWNSNDIRCATWAVLKDTRTKKPFCFLNTHLDHVSERARVEGTRLILKKLGKFKIPTIVTGDFNCGRYIPPGLTAPV